VFSSLYIFQELLLIEKLQILHYHKKKYIDLHFKIEIQDGYNPLVESVKVLSDSCFIYCFCLFCLWLHTKFLHRSHLAFWFVGRIQFYDLHIRKKFMEKRIGRSRNMVPLLTLQLIQLWVVHSHIRVKSTHVYERTYQWNGSQDSLTRSIGIITHYQERFIDNRQVPNLPKGFQTICKLRSQLDFLKEAWPQHRLFCEHFFETHDLLLTWRLNLVLLTMGNWWIFIPQCIVWYLYRYLVIQNR
jgi:hypothetical protein